MKRTGLHAVIPVSVACGRGRSLSTELESRRGTVSISLQTRLRVSFGSFTPFDVHSGDSDGLIARGYPRPGRPDFLSSRMVRL